MCHHYIRRFSFNLVYKNFTRKLLTNALLATQITQFNLIFSRPTENQFFFHENNIFCVCRFLLYRRRVGTTIVFMVFSTSVFHFDSQFRFQSQLFRHRSPFTSANTYIRSAFLLRPTYWPRRILLSD